MSVTHRRATAALLILALSTFSYVTIEVLPIGLLTVIADDLGKSRSEVGLLVTGYAAVVVIASIPLARLTLRLPRRLVLGTTLAVLAVSTGLSAVAPTYEILFATRLITALSQSLFWAIAPPIATSLFAPELRGRVVARLAIGTALAPVLGIPLGTWLGEQAGWRVPLGVMAVLGAVACAGILWLLPRVDAQNGTSGRGSAPNRRRYVVVLVSSAIGVTGFLTYNTYVTPFLLDISGFTRDALGPMLLVSGVGGLAGTIVVGRVLDRYPWGAVIVSYAVLSLALVSLYTLGQYQVAAIALIAMAGLAFSGMAVATQSRTLQVAPGSTDLASAGTSSAFNVGIAAGAFVGGGLINSTGVRSVALVGGLLAAAAVLVLLTEPLLTRRTRLDAETADPNTSPHGSHPRARRPAGTRG
jgi:DHA1 family L-arabinose/isopropyl-beta-D-thiogalactopyranoside export protein-like MFS transporter/DHA1 family inner membrane transport protein